MATNSKKINAEYGLSVGEYVDVVDTSGNITTTTITSRGTDINLTATNVVATKIGSSAALQNSLPAVNGDTFVVAAASQNVTNKTFGAGNTWNGNVVPMQYGGTGTTLSDPGADRILFWDDSAGANTWLTAGSSLVITTTTLDTIQAITTSSTPTFAGLTINGNLTVTGTTTSLNTTELTVDDINITLGDTASPTDTTANGGGITLRGSTNKTIIWDSANTNWTSSEHINIASGKQYKINNVQIAASNLSNGTTGSNSVVLATTPTIATPIITTSAVIPIVYGSSAASGTLTISSTSDVTKGVLTVGDSNAGTTTLQAATLNVKVGAAASAGFLKVAATTGLVSIDTNTYLTSSEIIPLANGGTNANLTANTGGIVYSGASAFAVLAGTATAGKMLQSGATAAPSWSTPTYPTASGTAGKVMRADGTNNAYSTFTIADTFAVDTIPFASSSNTLTALATTGTGNAVRATTPTIATPIITTSAVIPIVYGSSAASGTLTVSSTSDVTKGTLTLGDSNAGTTTLQASTMNIKVGAAASSGFLKVAATTGLVSIDTATYLTSAGAVTAFSAGTTGLTPSTDTSGAVTLAGTLAQTNGGTGSNITASVGGIIWSNTSGFAVLAGTSTAGKMLQSGASATPSWSTPTYPTASGSAGKVMRADGTNNAYSTFTIPDTFAINTIPYASSANTLAALAAGTNQVMTSNSSSVPTWTTLDASVHFPDYSFKKTVRVATAADLGASTFSAGVITGYDDTFSLNVTTTISSVNASTTSTAGLKVGATLSGNANITGGTTVATIVNATDFTLSVVAAASGTGVTTTVTQTIVDLTVDGVALSVNDRVLVKDQTKLGGMNATDAAKANGVYYVSATGSASVPWSLTRSTDADSSADISGSVVAVAAGTANAGRMFKTGFKSTDTINTTAMYWGSVSDRVSSALRPLPVTAIGIDVASPTETITTVGGNVTTLAVDSYGVKTVASTSTSTYTNAATVYIAGAPVASTNVTVANPYSLFVEAGNSSFGGGVTVTGNLTLGVADTATAATHYMVEIATDGVVRPKTLANVKSEIVTAASVAAITQVAGSATASAMAYSGTTKTLGTFYGGTTDPTNTTRLNYDGNIHATTFIGSGASLTGVGGTITAVAASATYYIGLSAASSGVWSDVRVDAPDMYYTSGDSTLYVTNINTASDARLKRDIKDIPAALADVNNMRGVKFTWENSGKDAYGVIAQEIEKIAPELVSEAEGRKSVNYNGLIGFLINAVNELSAKVDSLSKE